MESQVDWRNKKILDLIKASGDGLSVNEIIEQAEFSKNTVISHLKQLENNGRIRTIATISKTGRHVVKFVLNESTVKVPQEEREKWGFDLLHIQIDIRERETAGVLHLFRYMEIRNLSRNPISSIFGGLFSRKGQSWEEQNPVVLLKHGSATKRYDKGNKPRFLEFSNPYYLRYFMDLPKPLYEGECLIITSEEHRKDLTPVYTKADLQETKKFVFDLIKVKTDNESLTCRICQRETDAGPYSPVAAKEQMVPHLRSDKEVYALRWAMENPQPERDYRFEYRA